MKKLSLLLSVTILGLVALQPAWGDSFRLGNSQAVPSGLAGVPGGTFANGTFTTTGTIPTSTAPFGSNNPCGADSSAVGTTNCDATWTFNFGQYSSVTSASITLGLLGLDSATNANSVALFQLTNGAGMDFTAAFNLVADTTNISGRQLCNGLTTKCPEYNIYQFSITDGALLTLAGGTATFHFVMNGPGVSAFGSTTHNGAILDFSQLDITGTPVPEPSSLLLLASGTGVAFGFVRRKFHR